MLMNLALISTCITTISGAVLRATVYDAVPDEAHGEKWGISSIKFTIPSHAPRSFFSLLDQYETMVKYEGREQLVQVACHRNDECKCQFTMVKMPGFEGFIDNTRIGGKGISCQLPKEKFASNRDFYGRCHVQLDVKHLFEVANGDKSADKDSKESVCQVFVPTIPTKLVGAVKPEYESPEYGRDGIWNANYKIPVSPFNERHQYEINLIEKFSKDPILASCSNACECQITILGSSDFRCPFKFAPKDSFGTQCFLLVDFNEIIKPSRFGSGKEFCHSNGFTDIKYGPT